MYYIGFYQLCSAKTENHWLKTICFCETGGILLKINFDAILWNAQELRGSEILDFMVMYIYRIYTLDVHETSPRLQQSEWFRPFIRYKSGSLCLWFMSTNIQFFIFGVLLFVFFLIYWYFFFTNVPFSWGFTTVSNTNFMTYYFNPY